MQRLVLFIILALNVSTLFGQVPELDSLKALLDTTKRDTNTLKLLLEVANLQGRIDPASGLGYAVQAERLGIELNEPELQTDAISEIAILHYYLGNDSITLACFNRVMDIAKKLNNAELLANTAYNTGIIYNRKSDFDKALELFLTALHIQDSLGNKKTMGTIMNGIGSLYKDKGNLERSLEYYEESLAIHEETEHRSGLASVLHNMGSILDQMHKFEDAIQYYERSLELKREFNDLRTIGSTLSNLGINYKEQGDYQRALDYFNEAKEYQEKINNPYSLTFTYTGIGDSYLRMGNYDKAIKWMLKSNELAIEYGFKREESQNHQMMADAYYRMGSYREAYDHFKLFKEMEDTLFKDRYNVQMDELERKYMAEKKELEIQNLEQDKQLKEVLLGEQEEKVAQQRIQLVAFGTGLVVVLGLGVLALLAYRQKRKANSLLETQKSEIQQKNTDLTTAYSEISLQKDVIEEKNKSILDSINYAQRIQQAIMPPKDAVQRILPNSFVLLKPKDIVSGDFYWIQDLEGKAYFAAVDCTGHGVPGAMVSVVGYNGLNKCIKELKLRKPNEILDKLTEVVQETFGSEQTGVKDGMDIALCALNLSTGELEFAGANNNCYIISNTDLQILPADRQPIGEYTDHKPYTYHTHELQQGDTVFVFSDGYADQFGGPKGKKFKYAQFKQLLLSLQEFPIEQQGTVLDEKFESWKGELEQIDDVCVIGVRV